MDLSIYCDFNGKVITPKSSPIRNCMSCLDKFVDMNAMSRRMFALPVLLFRCVEPFYTDHKRLMTS